MASTNKTTNYELSQYIGTDKPTYLSDYNGDMYKIDAQMKVNADNIATAISSASTATSTANTANSTANSALSTAQSANTTANSASTTAGNAQSTANSALATATTAQSKANEVDTKLSNFNLTNFDTATVTKTGNATISESDITVAYNTDGSLAKIYGKITMTGLGEGTITISSALRPEESITIKGNLLRSTFSNGTCVDFNSASYTINTNGNITFKYGNVASGISNRFMFINSLLYIKDFGDTPEE